RRLASPELLLFCAAFPASPLGRPFFRARMRCIVRPGQILKVEVSIDLRARDARVPEQFLNRAKVPGRLQQMRCERVSQHMRMHMSREPAFHGPTRESLLDRTRNESPPRPAYEQGMEVAHGNLA